MRKHVVTLLVPFVVLASLALFVVGPASASTRMAHSRAVPLQGGPNRLNAAISAHEVSPSIIVAVARYRCNPNALTAYTFLSARLNVRLIEGTPLSVATGSATLNCNDQPQLLALRLNDAAGTAHPDANAADVQVTGTMVMRFLESPGGNGNSATLQVTNNGHEPVS